MTLERIDRRAHMALNPRAHDSQGAKQWRRQALQEYLPPGKGAAGGPILTA